MRFLSNDIYMCIFDKLNNKTKLKIILSTSIFHDYFPHIVLSKLYVEINNTFIIRNYWNDIQRFRVNYKAYELPPNVTHLRLNSESFLLGNNISLPLLTNLILEYHLHHYKLKPHFLVQPLDLTTVTHLTFDWSFNQPLKSFLNNLTHLTHLTFGNGFNQPLENCLNNLTELTHLTFGREFNKPLENSLNKLVNLTHLTFGNGFNKSIECLNNLSNLTYLTFGWAFNQTINSLSQLSCLTHISFCFGFDQSIEPLEKLKNLIEIRIETGGRTAIKPNIKKYCGNATVIFK